MNWLPKSLRGKRDWTKVGRRQLSCWKTNWKGHCWSSSFLQVHICVLKVCFVTQLIIADWSYIDMQADDSHWQEQVKELIQKTAGSLDNLALKMLFVQVQQNNLALCIKYAIKQQVHLETTYLILIIFSPALFPLTRIFQRFVFQLKLKTFNNIQFFTEKCYSELLDMVSPFICESINWFTYMVINIVYSMKWV